ncbi:MAG TPA: GNAT family N-acetyltransferase, partial [Ktedonobacterales bacterium]
MRDSTPADAEVVTDLINWEYPEPSTVEQVRERLRSSAPSRDVRRLVAEEGEAGDGRMIGYGHALRDDWMEPGLFWVHIAVAPAARRQGVGSTLFAALLDWARPLGATTLMTSPYEHHAESVQFAERHGFQIERHSFESRLDLSAFDERPFLSALDMTQAAGVRFVTMADLGDTPEARRKLYELDRLVARDIPGGSEAAIRPFETFIEQVCAAPGYHAGCQHIALDGEAWIGLALLEKMAATDAMYNGITGVLPAWRGQGIALALKLLAIRVARRYGARYLRTNNDSQNAPMLAVNRKLGYQPQPGFYRMRAQLMPSERI